MDVRDLQATGFSYDLPPERIARYPMPERDASRLLVYRNGEISDSIFREIDQYLPSGSLLVYNDTRVIQARLEFRKPSGARIEIFCLEPLDPPDYHSNLSGHASSSWKCLVGNARKWKSGTLKKKIVHEGETTLLFAERGEALDDSFRVTFRWQPPNISFGEILEQAGLTPIPPYLDRESEASDRERYQTIYSRFDGSVAAPTAGLHFTDAVLKRLQEKNIHSTSLLLHTGAGTFKPVQAIHIRHHVMHSEYFRVRLDSLERILQCLGKIIAVGTTTIRTLESLYLCGLMSARNTAGSFFVLDQWDPYEHISFKSAGEVLSNLVMTMKKNNWDFIEGTTRIMLVPCYRFRMTDMLITNFHMPRSTLLMLIAAFVGEDWKKIYQHALDNGFRFLSYGDSSLLFRS
jgi:S-adenosylmethionine:tRNA ribosyltransferase-isomerase